MGQKDFMVKDALGRSGKLGTIQVDYNLPERFDLTYIGEDNAKHRPIMIHRAPFGSFERFIGVLTEHCAGKFPLWLTPTQIILLPISNVFNDYAKVVQSALVKEGIRVEIDERHEKIGRKIRDAEVNKIPYMAILGEREMEENAVAIRQQGKGNIGTFSIEEWTNSMKKFAAITQLTIFTSAKTNLQHRRRQRGRRVVRENLTVSMILYAFKIFELWVTMLKWECIPQTKQKILLASSSST